MFFSRDSSPWLERKEASRGHMGQGFRKALWSVAPEWTLLLSVSVKSRQSKEVWETVFSLLASVAK